jgi:2-oxo-hept-3-ene-1,7-dioate hydratase
MDTISDNAANAALVVGDSPSARSISTCAGSARCCFKRPIEEDRVAPASSAIHNGVASSPTAVRQGEYLEAGQVVLAGSFIRPIDIIQGDTCLADYGQFGAVSCQFV